MKIILQRQGTGATIRTQHSTLVTTGCGSTNPGFYLELSDCRRPMGAKKDWPHPDSCWLYEVIRSRKEPLPDIRESGKLPPTSIQQARLNLAAIATRLLGFEIEIEDFTENYCVPVHMDDVMLLRCTYDPVSGSITTPDRSEPLVTWDQAGDIAAHSGPEEPNLPPHVQWNTIAADTIENYAQDVIMYSRIGTPERGIFKARERLAWLMSEYRKYGIGN